MDRSDGTQRRRQPRVVIVGAGFAGLYAAQELAKKPVDVTLIDRNNYHKFQPLLYQVATAGLEADDIVHPVRDIFRKDKNIRFILGTVHDIDREARQVHLVDADPIAYDYLLLAAGATTNYFGIDGADRYSFPLKNVPEALHLRNRILSQFERCERDPDAVGEGALTFVIVGGGPTGVEMAGQMMELFRCVMREDYRRVDPAQARVILIEMLPDLLSTYHPSLRRYTREVLEERGVEVRTETTVAFAEHNAVHLKSGERIPTQTLIWTAGVRANPLAGALGTPQTGGGRLVVNDDLSVPGHPEIFVAGDLAGAEDREGKMYAQLATVAIRQGRHAARQILRRAEGDETERFIFVDPGTMATIGRSAAIAELPGGIRVKGLPAWLLWAFVHIAQLVGFRNRLAVFMNWAYNYLTFDFNARLIMDVIPAPEAQMLPAYEARGEGQEAEQLATSRSDAGNHP